MIQPSQRMEGQMSTDREAKSWMESRQRLGSDLVDRLRDIVQPAMEVRRSEDSLTKAIRMILQITEETGKR